MNSVSYSGSNSSKEVLGTRMFIGKQIHSIGRATIYHPSDTLHHFTHYYFGVFHVHSHISVLRSLHNYTCRNRASAALLESMRLSTPKNCLYLCQKYIIFSGGEPTDGSTIICQSEVHFFTNNKHEYIFQIHRWS